MILEESKVTFKKQIACHFALMLSKLSIDGKRTILNMELISKFGNKIVRTYLRVNAIQMEESTKKQSMVQVVAVTPMTLFKECV